MARFTTELPSNSSADCHESFWSLNLEELVKKRKELEDLVEENLQRASASKAERIRRRLARADQKMSKDLKGEFNSIEMVKKGLNDENVDLWSLQGSFCPTNNTMDGQWTCGLDYGGWNITNWMNQKPMSGWLGSVDEIFMCVEVGPTEEASPMDDNSKVVEVVDETGAGNFVPLDLPLLQGHGSLQEGSSKSLGEDSSKSLEEDFSRSVDHDQTNYRTLSKRSEELVLMTKQPNGLSLKPIIRTLEVDFLVPNFVHGMRDWNENFLGSIHGLSHTWHKTHPISLIAFELYRHGLRSSRHVFDWEDDHEEARRLECISGPPW